MNVGETYKASWPVTSSNGFKFTMHLQIKLVSQDYANNKSKFTVYYGLACSSSGQRIWNGYSPTLKLGYKNHSDSTYTFSPTQTISSYTAGYDTTYESATYKYSYTWDVSHNADGTLSLDTEYVWTTGNFAYIPSNSTNAVTQLSIPQIPRQNTFTVTPTVLQEGDTMSITVTKQVNSYTSTVRYRVNSGSWKTLGTKSSRTSFSDSYANVSARLSSGATTGDVEIQVLTYNGDTQVGTTETKHISILTGTLPFSLYDNKAGSIGVTVGREAEGPGFNEFLDATFGDTINRITIDATNSKMWNSTDYTTPAYREGDTWVCNMSAIWPGYSDGSSPAGVIFGITLPASLRNINRITLDYIDAWCFVGTAAFHVTTGQIFSSSTEWHGQVSNLPQEQNKLRLKATGMSGLTGGWGGAVCAAIKLTFHES